jgi:hypothetical protein
MNLKRTCLSFLKPSLVISFEVKRIITLSIILLVFGDGATTNDNDGAAARLLGHFLHLTLPLHSRRRLWS